ncbi:MAG: hypothetical protein M2R45_02887 [Verrucomicrobia subdivision 3 bacterium]|nr:hypothetical protein [Limisphaerales bacterium]MCS1414739.1 hypothetical protein [Limisphaerales bacterium]
MLLLARQLLLLSLVLWLLPQRILAEPQEPKRELPSASIKQEVKNKSQGRALVTAMCTSCHSTMVIDTARKTKRSWQKTLDKMEQQGMPKIPASLREPILRYLANAQGLQDRNDQENWRPWADRRNANPLW